MKAFFCLFLLFTTSVSAKTILVSDVDDTIKITHVHGTTDLPFRAFSTNAVFKDMPSLYQLILANTEASMVYLSNGPQILFQSTVQKFLSENQFPPGELIMRTNVPRAEHKIVALRKMIREQKPSTMILIGDNGEQDIRTYDRIREEHPEIEFHIYIRTLYSSTTNPQILKLRPQQISFVTPDQIARDLGRKNMIDPATAERYSAEVFERVIHSPVSYAIEPAYITDWMDASDHQPAPEDQEPWPELQKYENSLFKTQCEIIFTR